MDFLSFLGYWFLIAWGGFLLLILIGSIFAAIRDAFRSKVGQ